jgi:predicted nucleotidyltransferase
VTPAELEIVSEILQLHIPQHEVWAFGSRVKGIVKPFSDLDLAILGEEPLTMGVLAALTEEFSESDLPYKVDIVDWATTDKAFRERIRAACSIIQQPGKNSSS